MDDSAYPTVIRRLNVCGYLIIVLDTGYVVQNVHVLDDWVTLATFGDVLRFTDVLEATTNCVAQRPMLSPAADHSM